MTDDIEDDRPLAVQREEERKTHAEQWLAYIKEQAETAKTAFHERYDRRKDSK